MSSKISELPLPLRLAALAVLGALAVVGLERGSAALNAGRAYPPPLERPLPPGLTSFSLSAALSGEARAAADVGYINCLQYMGGHNAPDGFWGQTLPLYREVQWLDPGFKHAILEGISALGWLYQRPVEAENLALAAFAADHREARYSVYIAALAYQEHLDSKAVLALLEPEVRRPDASEMLLRVVGNLIVKQGDRPRAERYWTWVESRSSDPETLDMARRTLIQIRKHLGSGALGNPSTHPAA